MKRKKEEDKIMLAACRIAGGLRTPTQFEIWAFHGGEVRMSPCGDREKE
jgi:hypothetical protein